MFWGHFAPGRHPAMPEKQWFDDIKNGWIDKNGNTGLGRPKWRTQIDYTGVGLQ
jgi:hypothetical protein